MTKSSDGILEAKQTPRAMGLAYSLWFVTAILAVLSYLAGREMILRSYVRFFPLGEGAYVPSPAGGGLGWGRPMPPASHRPWRLA